MKTKLNETAPKRIPASDKELALHPERKMMGFLVASHLLKVVRLLWVSVAAVGVVTASNATAGPSGATLLLASIQHSGPGNKCSFLRWNHCHQGPGIDANSGPAINLETMTISKPMTITAVGGPATIGQ
jgi:hypothetical protein